MDHDCKSSLDSIPDENAPKPWPVRKLIGVKNITARIGPTGGKRGYEAQTGKFQKYPFIELSCFIRIYLCVRVCI